MSRQVFISNMQPESLILLFFFPFILGASCGVCFLLIIFYGACLQVTTFITDIPEIAWLCHTHPRGPSDPLPLHFLYAFISGIQVSPPCCWWPLINVHRWYPTCFRQENFWSFLIVVFWSTWPSPFGSTWTWKVHLGQSGPSIPAWSIHPQTISPHLLYPSSFLPKSMPKRINGTIFK